MKTQGILLPAKELGMTHKKRKFDWKLAANALGILAELVKVVKAFF